jgi:hypothetical protein
MARYEHLPIYRDALNLIAKHERCGSYLTASTIAPVTGWVWTLSVYLSMAEFSVNKDDHQIGMASYTANLGPSAIGRTKNKIRPLLIELFRK